MHRYDDDGLEELSIEEEIMVHNIDGQELKNPTMTILTSENVLPPRSWSLIGSLVIWEAQ